MLLWLCLPLGASAGLLAGLLGIGGGLLLVPALALLLPLASGVEAQSALPMAVATSLASILVTAPASAAAHARRGAVDWKAASLLAPGFMVGAAAAGLLGGRFPTPALALIVAAFFLFAAWRLARDRARPVGVLAWHWLPVASPPIGALSALVGIGGGTLVVPLLLRAGRTMHRAIGTAAACGLPIALGGALGWSLGTRETGAVWWPGALVLGAASAAAAPLGAAFAHRAPARALKRLFAGFLLLSAVAVIWRHF